MTDLHTRFRTLDKLSAPNLWNDIEERAMAAQPTTRRSGAWVLIAVTLLLALAIGGAVLVGLGIVKLPAVVDASATPSATAQESIAASASPVAQVPSSWTATGSMIAARVDFTATLLLDGRVLVAGGDRGFDAVPRALSSAELYDPATGTWSATGSMLQGRYRHTATLLPNGKVLVAAGNVSSSSQVGDACCLASAELYDPATGTWTATGSMMAARVAHTATLLLDGTVLVAGGDYPGTGLLVTAELYNPDSGRWTATGNMIDASNPGRYAHNATQLRDGRVFVIGGQTPQSPAELYDPRTGSWSETDCCTDAPNRFGPYMTATLLPDGKVLVAGGLDAEGVLSPSAALYDPARGRWTATGSMLVTREAFTATRLIDGKVLVAAGSPRGASPFATAELYDPSTGTWIATATMVEGRHGQMAILLLDGRVLVAGGSGPEVLDPATSQYSTPNLASAELYDPGIGN